MKYTCLALLVTLACSMAGGDTLILKDGQKIEGRYLSSTDSAVQFEVNGKPFTYSTWLIRELRFHPGASPSPAPAMAYSGPRGKEQQDQFCAVLKDYIQARNKVAAEANPIRRAEMHPPDPWSFENLIARVFGPNGEFVDWTGRLFFSVTGSDVVLTFQPTCGSGSSISFTNGYPADQRASVRAAHIPLSSPLAEKLREASPGGVFRVSGDLFARDRAGTSHMTSAGNQSDARQRFEGAQANAAANVTNPQYLAQFTDLAAAGH
ncbi:MAG: hypothetical protein JOZ62_06260 [Acidobacteriaceae bacterium]|nr:hypothetical protein [Acidobacteriaceae bacterium]